MSHPDSTDSPKDTRDVLAEVERAIASLQGHADAGVRGAVNTLLEGIDAVHRAGLTHLVQAIHGLAGETLINRLIADPAIRMLLMSYDLVAVDRRLQAEEALDTVRGHLHDHGVDVEILEVVGGVVYVRLHHSRAGEGELAHDRVRADLEATLRELFVGFQELVLREREPAMSAVVPLEALRRANRPVYHDAGDANEILEGELRAVVVNDVSVLFARVGGEIYAVRNQCGDSPLPLDMGALEGAEIRCPWHGCRYDVRTGRRLDDDGRVQVIPVKDDAGRVQVALDVEAAAR